MRCLVLDMETECLPWYGSVASPYNPENYCVMDAYESFELRNPSEVSERVERRFDSVEDFKARWTVPFDEIDILVAHNAAYEMSWLLEHDYDNFLAFLKRGGRVFCTAYAHYLLSNQQDLYPALNDIAPLYGGTPKVDAVKAMWQAGALTSEIDKDLLSEYLSGPCGDIANTTKVFLGVWGQLKERGMLKMALVRMEGLLYSSFCMHNGLYVDMVVANKHKRDNEINLAELREQSFNLLPGDMPQEAREQFRGTRYQLSALIFGGAMKYETQVPRTDANGSPIYVKVEAPLFKTKGGTYTLPKSFCVWDEEAGGLWYDFRGKVHQTRYTAGKNKGLPKYDKIVTDEMQTKKGEKLYTFPGLLSAKMLKKLHTEITKNWAGSQKMPCGNPVVSTSGDVIDVLVANGAKELQVFQEITAVQKDLGAFYLVQEYNAAGEVKKTSGMLQYVQDDGIVHHSLNHTSTATGRLSSARPNAQNLPRGDKSRVKEMFKSRFGKAGSIMQKDYSALENVGQQVLSGDKALRDALLDGKDMHCMRLAVLEGKSYEYVLARAKDPNHPEHAEWDLKRINVKPAAFTYAFGGSAYAISMTTGLPLEFCEEFIAAEKKTFPGIEKWYDEVVYPTVYASSDTREPQRVVLDNGASWMQRSGVFQTHDGTCYEFKERTKEQWDSVEKRMKTVREIPTTQMRNYPIQGSSGFFVQMACGLLIRHFISKDFYGNKALPINTVHDATYFDVDNSVLEQVSLETEEIMECIPEFLNAYWPAYNCEVPFPVAGGAGASMAEEEPVYKDKEEYLRRKREFKKQYLSNRGLKPLFN